MRAQQFRFHRLSARYGNVGKARSPGADVPRGGAALKSGHAASNGEPKPPHRSDEASDDYPHVVAILDSRTRVIECAQGVQWIIQKRCAGRWPWRSRYFCRTKEGLLLYARPIVPGLVALPDHFARRTGRESIGWLSDDDAR